MSSNLDYVVEHQFKSKMEFYSTARRFIKIKIDLYPESKPEKRYYSLRLQQTNQLLGGRLNLVITMIFLKVSHTSVSIHDL